MASSSLDDLYIRSCYLRNGKTALSTTARALPDDPRVAGPPQQRSANAQGYQLLDVGTAQAVPFFVADRCYRGLLRYESAEYDADQSKTDAEDPGALSVCTSRSGVDGSLPVFTELSLFLFGPANEYLKFAYPATIAPSKCVVYGTVGQVITSAVQVPRAASAGHEGLNIGDGNFVVYSATGNTNIAGIVDVSGHLRAKDALTVSRNAEIGADLSVTGTLIVSSTTNSTAKDNGAFTVAGGAGVAGNLHVGGHAVVAGPLNVGSSVSFADTVHVASTAPSTNTSTGALVISGGVGVAKELHVGGDAGVAGSLAVSGSLALDGGIGVTSTATTAIVAAGGLEIAGPATVGGVLKTGNDTQASSALTGALQTAGGLGVAKDAHVGGAITCNAFTATTEVRANEFIALSDERLKQNIAALKPDEALDLVDKLKPKTYQMKSDPGHNRCGLLAQEVQRVLPSCVQPHTTPSTSNKTTAPPLGVNYTDIVSYLIAAVKELKARVQELKEGTPPAPPVPAAVPPVAVVQASA